MRKLTLSIEALHVESFEARPAPAEPKGTVHAEETFTCGLSCWEPQYASECGGSCFEIC